MAMMAGVSAKKGSPTEGQRVEQELSVLHAVVFLPCKFLINSSGVSVTQKMLFRSFWIDQSTYFLR